MNSRFALILAAGGGVLLAVMGSAPAATSITNSFTGFSGNSTQAATQGAVGSAGFNFFSTAGLNDPDFTSDPTVVFDTNGATFGSLFGGDGGRNYVRTIESDYVTTSFVAEVTFVTTNLAGQDAFIGMGSGDTALFGWPDWSTQLSSVIFTPEITDSGVAQFTTMFTTNDTPVFANTAAPSLMSGTNRIRMTYDVTNQSVVFAMDYNYAGGPFVQDQAAPTLQVNTLFADSGVFDAADYTVWRDTLGSTTDLRANFTNQDGLTTVNQADYDYWVLNFGQAQSGGWPSEPSRIFFGGDDGVIFKDFSVVVAGSGIASGAAVPEPAAGMIVVLGIGCFAARLLKIA